MKLLSTMCQIGHILFSMSLNRSNKKNLQVLSKNKLTRQSLCWVEFGLKPTQLDFSTIYWIVQTKKPMPLIITRNHGMRANI